MILDGNGDEVPGTPVVDLGLPDCTGLGDLDVGEDVLFVPPCSVPGLGGVTA